ncbi:copper homeostasis protein CutC [Haliscomenobacter sp.]|uniref:copper homeostasis protein CutC n=1 Tax=Haliscomenobacter sp. TaxID=2717303 RepID=UPI00359444C6
MKAEIEVCVDTLEAALQAQADGATRIELCGRLDLDGLTPDEDFIQQALQELAIPIHVMIRPRGGDFVYTAEELGQMELEIAYCKAQGVPGVVLGALTSSGELDLENILKLATLAKPEMLVVVHKCIDYTPDPVAAFEHLLAHHNLIDYVLTSGGKPTAREGLPVLRQMVALSKGRIKVMAAGKITKENLEALAAEIGGPAYHGRLIV